MDRQRQAALDAARNNLALWHEEIARCEELSLLQAESAAYLLHEHTVEALQESQAPSHSEAVRVTKLGERVAICRFLAQKSQETARKQPTVPNTQAPRVAMLNGPAFAEAMKAFRTVLPSAEPHICHSFADILEEVAGSRVHFGILPIEDSTQGKLFRIYEECERLELHIAYTADQKDEDGKTVRMALLYKNAVPDAPPPEGERTLECLLFDDAYALSDLLTVAKALGVTLRRVDSLPLSYREDGFVQHAVLHGGRNETKSLLTYLALFMPHTTVTADYINIKAKETP